MALRISIPGCDEVEDATSDDEEIQAFAEEITDRLYDIEDE
jgi:hypothetical protein